MDELFSILDVANLSSRSRDLETPFGIAIVLSGISECCYRYLERGYIGIMTRLGFSIMNCFGEQRRFVKDSASGVSEVKKNGGC